jgi:hypothetical protein
VKFEAYRFGSLEIDGTRFDHDVVVDRGEVRKRRKGPSKRFRDTFGHTPLSAGEDIPWSCRRLVIGTGASGSLPVMSEVGEEARRRDVELVVLPTEEALGVLTADQPETNAILHVTC